MGHTLKKLKNSQVELTITVTPKEYAEPMEQAAARVSNKVNIKGFRKGKAPYDIVKKEVGEMAIMQEALESIVQKSFFEAVKEEKLETIGSPKIELEKSAPGNDLVYKATVALLPEVTIPDLKKIKVKITPKEITDKDVEETIDALRGMHAIETITDKAATEKDKLIIDMNMLVDNVPIDGGQAKDYQVYLSEKHYIPGFNKKLIGVKKGENKKFSLEFPEDHYQKMLAGNKVDFDITVKEVFERKLAELNEDFAKKLGQKSIEELKKLVKSNQTHDAIHKAEEKAEIEILEKIIEKAKFSDIPEVLIDAEKQKIFFELKRNLEKNGVPLEKYLEDIKKTEKELFEDFKAQAIKRAKAALVSREVAKSNDITVSETDIDQEIEMLKGMYQNKPEYIEHLGRKEVRDTVAIQIQNKKVTKFLKEQIIGKENLHVHEHKDKK